MTMPYTPPNPNNGPQLKLISFSLPCRIKSVKERIRWDKGGSRWVSEEEILRNVCRGCCDVKQNRGIHSKGKRTARKDGSVTFLSDKHDPVST